MSHAEKLRRSERRNLVIVRAGDSSLHEQWIRGERRDFDLFISYFGSTAGLYAEQGDYYESRRGPKWPGIAQLLDEHAGIAERYDTVWFPDDDLAVDTETLNRMFAFFHAFGMSLAQPALTRDSFCTWRTLRQDVGCHVRSTGFVEIMAPLFSREALRVCRETFGESPSGWGLDWVWPRMIREAKLAPLAVIDATPVRHTRPCGGELYHANPALEPREDARRVLARYAAYDSRIAAKYTFGHRVADVPVPLVLRLWYATRIFFRKRNARLDPRRC